MGGAVARGVASVQKCMLGMCRLSARSRHGLADQTEHCMLMSALYVFGCLALTAFHGWLVWLRACRPRPEPTWLCRISVDHPQGKALNACCAVTAQQGTGEGKMPLCKRLRQVTSTPALGPATSVLPSITSCKLHPRCKLKAGSPQPASQSAQPRLPEQDLSTPHSCHWGPAGTSDLALAHIRACTAVQARPPQEIRCLAGCHG